MDLFTLFGSWTPWLVLAPLAAWLGWRVRIEQGSVLRGLAVHFIALGCVVLAGFVFRSLLPALLPEPAGRMLVPPWLREAQRPALPGAPPGGAANSAPNTAPGQVPGQVPNAVQSGPLGMPPGVPPEMRRARRLPGPPPFAHVALDALVYGILASIGAAMAASRRAREREKSALRAQAELAQARLAALQLQLNPHFLFNALNGISSLIHTDPHAADDMLADLSHLLRAALDTAGSARIALARELQILDSYLGIEQRRFGPRLKIHKQISPAALRAMVPTFVLQPLVENAIKHGIERRRGQGTIHVGAARDGARLRLWVHDDGPGVGAEGADAAGFGIGLANTRERLQQLYGSAFVLTLANAPEGGCRATIELPFVAAESSAAAEHLPAMLGTAFTAQAGRSISP